MSLLIEITFFIVLLLIIIINIILYLFGKVMKKDENESKLSGFEIAQIISSKYAPAEPHIIKKSGSMLDHYNMERNVIKLSPGVFDGTNIYAGVIAANIALETTEKRQKQSKGHRFSSFLVIASYIMIILGACLNNVRIILFGLILFILAFIIECLLIEILIRSVDDPYDLSTIIKKEKLIKPYEDNKDYLIIFLLINIATLPYSFIRYFR